jgi:hypothetical protein
MMDDMHPPNQEPWLVPNYSSLRSWLTTAVTPQQETHKHTHNRNTQEEEEEEEE